ncbi:hypothetical protein BDN72DRAFT_865968, partial [Pluteus cervinus]
MPVSQDYKARGMHDCKCCNVPPAKCPTRRKWLVHRSFHTSEQYSPEPTEPEDNTPVLTAAEKRKLTRQKNIKEQEELDQLNQEDCGVDVGKQTRRGKAIAKDNKGPHICAVSVWLSLLSESQQKRREQLPAPEEPVAESSKKRKQDLVDGMTNSQRSVKQNTGKARKEAQPSDDEMSVDEGLGAAEARDYQAPNLDLDSEDENYAGGFSQVPVFTPTLDLSGDISMGEPDEGGAETVLNEDLEEEPQAEGSGPKDNEEEVETKEDDSSSEDEGGANDANGANDDNGDGSDGDDEESEDGDNGNNDGGDDGDSDGGDSDGSTTESSDTESSVSGRDIDEEKEEVDNLDNEATPWFGNGSGPMSFNNAETENPEMAVDTSFPPDNNDEPPASEGEPEPTNMLGDRARTPPAKNVKKTSGQTLGSWNQAPVRGELSILVEHWIFVGDWCPPTALAPPSAKPKRPKALATSPPPPTTQPEQPKSLGVIKEVEWPPEATLLFDGRKRRSERLCLNRQHPTLHEIVTSAIAEANAMVMLEHPWPLPLPDETQNTQYCIERAVLEADGKLDAQAIYDRSQSGDREFLNEIQKVILHRNTLSRGQVKGFSVNHVGDSFRLKGLALPQLQAKIKLLLKNDKCTLPYDGDTGKVDKGRPWQNQTLLATSAFVIHKNGNKSLFRRHPELFLQ